MTVEIPASRVIRRGDRGYPKLLAASPDPPERLFCLGRSELLGRPAVAVVGARKATGLGLAMGERLGAGLAEAGVVVVSGCAVGVDAAAHRGTLSEGGETVAVLGGGLDVSAPASNRALAERIGREGCLVSEHPAGMPPLKHHFPRRNRIIAGLSRIVVVVEAASRSGALITARLALAAGREVMAVPGHPLLGSCEGANALVADGARPVLSVEDVLDELARLPGVEFSRSLSPRVRAAAVSPVVTGPDDVVAGSERTVRSRLKLALTPAPVAAEALAEEIGASISEVFTALTELELAGAVRVHPGGRFSRGSERGQTDR